MNRLVVLIAFAAAGLAGACSGGSSTGGTVSMTLDGASWHSPAQGFIIAGTNGVTNFTLQGATPLPNSTLIDSDKPQLLIVFPQDVPSVGTYITDGVRVTVEYQVDVNTFYSGTNGSVQIASISTSRAQGSFNFELDSPNNNPLVLIATDGAFDVPVSSH